MVTWSALPEDFPDSAWDKALLSLRDHSIFQSSAWARHKRDSGWTVLRLIAGSRENPQAAAQFLLRRYPMGVCLMWSRGGPVADAQAWQGLVEALAKVAGSWIAYARVCSYRPLEENEMRLIKEMGWNRPARALNRNATFLLDLSPDEPTLRRDLSSNWSHNLRRAEKRCLGARRWEAPQASELERIYRDMEQYKGMRAQYGAHELKSLLGCLGESVLLYRVDDEQGRPIALRACAIQGRKAWDLLAASSEAGRKNYASYMLLWTVLLDCRARGILEYDLGGADPDQAKGVFDFKNGTGARFVEYLGEWDWARPASLRALASAVISRRMGVP